MARRARRTKPEWDTALPGNLRRFKKRVTRDEIAEAHRNAIAELASGPARAMLHEDERWIAAAVDREKMYRANLEQFAGTRRGEAYRKDLASTLLDLGEFEQVLELLRQGSGVRGQGPVRARRGCAALVKETLELQHAVERDDSEICGCAGQTATLSHPIAGNDKREYSVELKRLHVHRRIYSKKHGQVVRVWRCSSCGDRNGHLNIPEGHETLEEARLLVQQVAASLPAGTPPRKFPFEASHGDHAILKA